MLKNIPFAMLAMASLLAPSGCQVDPAAPAERLAGEGQADETAQFCGGFANLPCDDGFVCTDNPMDDCDPHKGGSDCGGICVPVQECGVDSRYYISANPQTCTVMRFWCDPGTAAFFNECGCGCEPLPDEACGIATCARDETCCNPGCGICVPRGAACIEVECEVASSFKIVAPLVTAPVQVGR